MNMNHTPGPWAFSRSERFGCTGFYIAQAEGAPYTPAYSDVATLIAETCSGDHIGIQEANARLIAAAPLLLDALRQWAAAERDGDAAELASARIARDAAIAAATN